MRKLAKSKETRITLINTDYADSYFRVIVGNRLREEMTKRGKEMSFPAKKHGG